MIILTGFEKFSRYNVNLSEILVKQFENRIGDIQIQKLILPVSWRRSITCYENKVSKLSEFPDLVILIGIHCDGLLIKVCLIQFQYLTLN